MKCVKSRSYKDMSYIWLSNSALVYEPKWGGGWGGGGLQGLSQEVHLQSVYTGPKQAVDIQLHIEPMRKIQPRIQKHRLSSLF